MDAAEADDGPVNLSMEERQTIVKYVDHLMESGEGHWPEFRCATPEETKGKNILDLRSMLAMRGLTMTDNKATLIERLHTINPDRRKMTRRYYQTTFREVWRLIDRYGDGGQDMQEEMGRVEYWLSHIDLEFIRK